MRTIYKYSLPFGEKAEVELPVGAEILDIASPSGNPDDLIIWCMVDTDQPTEKRIFYIRGTGHAVPKHLTWYDHLETVHVKGLVWHIFEEPRPNSDIHLICRESAAHLRQQIEDAHIELASLQQ